MDSDYEIIGSQPGDGRGDTAGSDPERALLRRYLLMRALGTSFARMVQAVGVLLLAGAVGLWLVHLPVLAVLVGIAAFGLLIVRTLVSGLFRRLFAPRSNPTAEATIAALVTQTSRGLRRELKRVGLPSVPWAALSVVRRLLSRTRRAETARRLADVSLDELVSPQQLEKLRHLLRSS